MLVGVALVIERMLDGARLEVLHWLARRSHLAEASVYIVNYVQVGGLKWLSVTPMTAEVKEFQTWL